MKVRVSVTPKDIEAGRQGCGGRCPVALSLARRINPLFRVHVYPWAVRLDRGRTEWREFDLSASMVAWICEFDTLGPKAVHPTSFTLDIPKRYLRKAR